MGRKLLRACRVPSPYLVQAVGKFPATDDERLVGEIIEAALQYLQSLRLPLLRRQLPCTLVGHVLRVLDLEGNEIGGADLAEELALRLSRWPLEPRHRPLAVLVRHHYLEHEAAARMGLQQEAPLGIVVVAADLLNVLEAARGRKRLEEGAAGRFSGKRRQILRQEQSGNVGRALCASRATSKQSNAQAEQRAAPTRKWRVCRVQGALTSPEASSAKWIAKGNLVISSWTSAATSFASTALAACAIWSFSSLSTASLTAFSSSFVVTFFAVVVSAVNVVGPQQKGEPL